MIMITSHIAGLFEVASLFFEKAVLADSSVSYLPRNCKNTESINYIITGTTIHRMALQFVRDLKNHCNISSGPAIMFGVIALSSNLFCLSQTVFRPAENRETILSVFLINSTLGYMFWINFTFQHMISSSESIPLTTYNTNWYETSIPTQKLLQLIILKSNRGFKFNILSVYAPSVEGFAVLLKASVSYFTVLLSLQ
ncbi:odorant receptor 43a-like [Megachile rotundata]|uniref:odorant receptor 43a-like n=1 Tax=Megachile rotundata TaxID=143995 RepID=UPI003FD25163